jgi:hypothetical protein
MIGIVDEEERKGEGRDALFFEVKIIPAASL